MFKRSRTYCLKLGSDGSLSALQTAPTVTPLGGTLSLTADPSGKYLYAISPDTSLITGYSVDQTTGALRQIQGLPLPTGIGPYQAVFAP
jgi:6-phosphogluconolactonase (cycloisomerase 2 family)